MEILENYATGKPEKGGRGHKNDQEGKRKCDNRETRRKRLKNAQEGRKKMQ